MEFIEKFVHETAKFTSQLISGSGYFGVFILMAAESTMVPLPSELVMPFAGYLAYTGKFNFWFVAFISALGTIFGSLFSYYIGEYGGEPFLEKYGRYLLINQKDLEWTHKWFNHHGEKTIFISRFIPVVRHLISIPAGIAEMNVMRFTIFTFLGGFLWNTFLTYLGYKLGENWELVRQYTKPFSHAVAGLLLLGVIFFIYKHVYRK
ncbi:MAG: DedA family protein [Nitrospiraceae bacterium]|nr:MAG: DedA family protein [Nitrospiraceae bacterium]